MAYDSIIPNAFPNLYSDQWRLGVQQLGSRLSGYVNSEVIHGEGKRYQKLAPVTARQITTRFGDTNPDDLDVEFRWLYVNFKDSAHILDRREALQLGSVGSPHSQVLRLQLAAAGRDMDKTLIDAIRGNVANGKNGTATPIALPNGQKISVSLGAANSNLNFDKVLEALRLLGSANVTGQDVEGNSPVTLVISHNQVAALLKEAKFTSTDYSELRRLHTGQVVNLMGMAIKAVDPNLLPYDSGTAVRSCYAFARESVVFGMAESPQAWSDVLPGKRHDVQLRTEWGWGALRLDDEGVIEIPCDES